MSYTHKKRENGKLKIQQLSSLMFPSKEYAVHVKEMEIGAISMHIWRIQKP